MKTILITGGAGFIGSTFAHYIFNKYPKYKLIVVDVLTYAGAIENLPVSIWNENHENFEFWYGSVMNGELMDTLIAKSDMVVHFAAESHVTRSIYDNTQFFETDVLGTQTLTNAVCKYKDSVERFVHISTSEVYGTAEFEFMMEEHPMNPLSPYAAAKAGADRLVYSYYKTYDIPAVIVRPFNNYGPRQHLEKLIPRFVTNLLSQKPLRIHGDGEAARDFVYAEDTCSAIDLILHSPKEQVVGEVFNVGTGRHRTINSIAEDIGGILGIIPEKNYVGDRPGQVSRHTSDSSKIREILGWEPKMDWIDGLRQTVDWYRHNREWWEKQQWMTDIPIITASGKKELH